MIVNDLVYKYFFFEDMVSKPKFYEQMEKEYKVAQMARANEFQYVLGLSAVHLGFNHVAFAYKKYTFDLRQYLREA